MPGTSNGRILDKSYSGSSKINNFRSCREVDFITHSFPSLPSDVIHYKLWLFLWISCEPPDTAALNMTTSVRLSLCYPKKRLSHMKNHLVIFPSSQIKSALKLFGKQLSQSIITSSFSSVHFTTSPHTLCPLPG